MDPAELCERADHYRMMAIQVTDAQTGKDCSNWRSVMKRWRVGSNDQ